ncbi:MAG: hypothetical protein Tsb0017_08930 [Geothermobacteraceae bacterium]
MGTEVFPVISDNKKPRWFHRGQLSTGNPQSFSRIITQIGTDFKLKLPIQAEPAPRGAGS